MNHSELNLEWSCRRGMLELDNLIMPFYKLHFKTLSQQQKDTFIRLLSSSDLQLFSWFFNRTSAPDNALQEMVNIILSMVKNQSNETKN